MLVAAISLCVESADALGVSNELEGFVDTVVLSLTALEAEAVAVYEGLHSSDDGSLRRAAVDRWIEAAIAFQILQGPSPQTTTTDHKPADSETTTTTLAIAAPTIETQRTESDDVSALPALLLLGAAGYWLYRRRATGKTK